MTNSSPKTDQARDKELRKEIEAIVHSSLYFIDLNAERRALIMIDQLLSLIHKLNRELLEEIRLVGFDKKSGTYDLDSIAGEVLIKIDELNDQKFS